MKSETTMVVVAVLFLVCTGMLMVYSTTEIDHPDGANPLKHLVYVGIGFIFLNLAARFDYHRLSDPIIYRILIVVTFLLLVLVLIPGIGIEVNGARRWLSIFGIRFQPSELGKFTLIVLLAVKLTQNREEIKSFFGGFMPTMLIGGFFAFMVLLERDLGVPAMMMGVTFVMAFVAGVRWRYLLLSMAPAVMALGALIAVAPHRMDRITAFLNPWQDPYDTGFTAIQSFIAYAHGSLWGTGIGGGEQKLGYITYCHTDFVFPIIGEELGLWGVLLVILAFGAFMIAALRIVMYSRDTFGAMLACGITALITGQAIFIMGATTGLLPNKGMPLPYISYGGTALVVFMTLAGILANVGVQAQPNEKSSRYSSAVTA